MKTECSSDMKKLIQKLVFLSVIVNRYFILTLKDILSTLFFLKKIFSPHKPLVIIYLCGFLFYKK